ncbi:sugar phosphate nucleotidyltransferase [Virgibacillus sp. CBA3643]|uniref:sugar phosphate nucleotidyltransferase n=1 Tax=Virgibacillus sp. CBA3643 TaxID=2942278 RepID=UPI0035A2B473
MNVINLVLASGLGSRLYPLSTDEKPKQFLSLIGGNTMIEDTLNRFKPFVDDSYIITLERYERYVSDLKTSVIFEEERKESAISVHQAINSISSDLQPSNTIIIQSPSDHHIKEDEHFKKSINEAVTYAKSGKLAIIGVDPTKPCSDYGHIKQDHEMVEKPTLSKASDLMENGYLWNTAIYVYPLGKMIKYFNSYFNHEVTAFEKVILPNITDDIKVISSDMDWTDIGTHERLESFGNEKGVQQ